MNKVSKEEILLKIFTKLAEEKKAKTDLKKTAGSAEAAVKGGSLLWKLLKGTALMGAGALGYKAISPTLTDWSDQWRTMWGDDPTLYYYIKQLRDVANSSSSVEDMARRLNTLRQDMFYQNRARANALLNPFGYRPVSNKQYSKLKNRFSNSRDFSVYF